MLSPHLMPRFLRPWMMMLFGACALAGMLQAKAPARVEGLGAPVAIADLPMILPKTDCAGLMKLDLSRIAGSGSEVRSSQVMTGAQKEPVCVVEGTLAPAIRFRVELPTRTWTQRFLQTGCGGLCGNVSIQIGAADGCPTVDRSGFVLASTDMGHEGMDGGFGRDPQLRADFAYRGVHLTAMAAKALIRAFYGRPERYSYFSGCSDGGREALIEAQRFPNDFNGIIAGAAAMNFVVQNSLFHAWQARSNSGPDGKPILLASRLPILHAAVLKACDALDGVTDGLISLPTQCHFDPMSIVCHPNQDNTGCLTPAEAMVARRFYDGPRDPKTHERLTVGGPLPGSELQWAGVYVPMASDQPLFSTIIAEGAMSSLIFADGSPATIAQVSFDKATFENVVERYKLFDSTDPDVSRFVARGGKLILFHGWADPHISPLNTIGYHQALQARFGAARTASFERLYLMPGMGHCSWGEGPSACDLLTPMMAWVERDNAPDGVLTQTPSRASRFGLAGGGPRGPGGPQANESSHDGPPRPMGPPPGMQDQPAGPSRSRPVFPYPFVGTFVGHGDPNSASSWVKGKATPSVVPQWAGSRLYEAYSGPTT